MDTQNDAIFEAGDTPFKEPSFLVPMLDFGGCTDNETTNHLKMYPLLKNGDFPASHVSFLRSTPWKTSVSSKKSGWKETFPFELALF